MHLPNALWVPAILLAFCSHLFSLQHSTSINGQTDPTISGPWKQDSTELYEGKTVVAHQVLVKFKSLPDLPLAARIQARSSSLQDVIHQHAVQRHRPVGQSGAELLEAPTRDVRSLIRELANRGDVEYVEPNSVGYQLDTVPNDPFFGQLWALRNTGQIIDNTPAGTPGADISATKAWDISKGSKANVVAIIDSGIWSNHPDLTANIWTASRSFSVTVGGVQYNCPAGTQGFDTLDKPESCGTSQTTLSDIFNGHGTFVAGIIGANGNNSTGIVGVNWVASMMILHAISPSGNLNTADAVDAIHFVVQAKQAGAANVRVINASWAAGDPTPSQTLYAEIMAANSSDILFVAAAGNSSNNNDQIPIYPANFGAPNCRFPSGATCFAPNVISVANTNNQDTLDFSSDFGPTSVHLAAPGTRIYSTVLNGGYDFLGLTRGTGTSASAPQVTGAAALVLSTCSALNTSQLKTNLLNNVDAKASLTGKVITGGRLNVNKALRACAVYPLSVSILDFSTGLGKVTSSPAGINCGKGSTSCTANFPIGTTVTLTAQGGSTPPRPPVDSGTSITFQAWGGSCSGTGACSVVMNSSKHVDTYFCMKGPGHAIACSQPWGL